MDFTFIAVCAAALYFAFQWDKQVNRAIQERADMTQRLERIEDLLTERER